MLSKMQNLEFKNNSWLTFSNFKNNYTVTVNKTVDYWWKIEKYINETKKWSHTRTTQMLATDLWERNKSNSKIKAFQQMVLQQQDIHMQNTRTHTKKPQQILDTYLTQNLTQNRS